MARDWEAQFRAWAAAPGTAEREKIERAEREVRAALNASSRLSARTVEVFPQGSYRNRTNVPRESDVDICARCDDSIFYDFIPDSEVTKRAAAITPATYTYADYKNEVEAALVVRFGRTAVKRGDKAFNVRETQSRVEADVIATFQYRRYTGVDYHGRTTYVSGTAFVPDSTHVRVVNWPQQHYDNGVAKNSRTGERFKAVVRILKNLRNEMEDQRVAQAKPIPSYLIECLIWNVPDANFGHPRFHDEMGETLRWLYHNTKSAELCSKWVEVNQLKWLFRAQPWTSQQVNAFVLAAWGYAGFGDSS